MFSALAKWFQRRVQPKGSMVLLPITEEQRKLIYKHFKRSNVNIKYDSGEYVLTHNVHAKYRGIELAFRNVDDKLYVSVAHYANLQHSGIPLCHTDHEADTNEQMNYLKSIS